MSLQIEWKPSSEGHLTISTRKIFGPTKITNKQISKKRILIRNLLNLHSFAEFESLVIFRPLLKKARPRGERA